MLSHLSIRHYALIDFLDIEFTDGLNIITGETGSGKSIILGALGLILGERADKRMVWKGEKKCVVEGAFILDERTWKKSFEENDLDFEERTIFRREVLVSGKSRAFINDTPVNVKLMQSFGLRLVDIHSQHQTMKLNDGSYQLAVLDAFAKVQKEKKKYEETHSEYLAKQKRIREIEAHLAEATRERDFIAFQLEEFRAVQLDDIDEEAIEEEHGILSNSEEIAEKLNGIKSILDEGESPVLAKLHHTGNLLEGLADYAGIYRDLSGRLKSLIIELDDLSAEVARLADDIEINPERLSELEELRSAIFRLEKKHFVSGLQALIQRRDELKQKVLDTDGFEVELAKLKEDLEKVTKTLFEAGRALREKRLKASPDFSEEITSLLKSLNMKKATFRVDIKPKEVPSHHGMDEIEMLFSANPGHAVEPLRKIASGGELSRLMLAIKRLSVSDLQTVILDEIDTGVSGEVAHAMGRIMKGMGSNRRVVAITHLPQIASKGDSHFKVFKEELNGVSRTRIERLTEEERIAEIARMLSGAEMTKAAIDNARELLHAD